MKYSAADPGVRPHKQLGLIVPWTVFNLLACAWFVALFIGLVRGPTARRTPMLLSLYAVFVLATAAGPMLSWTGRVMTPEVPVPLCVVSAAFGSSWSLAQVSAAFALVLKVWTHTLVVRYPPATALNWVSTSLLPPLIPWVVALPFFITSLIMGALHPAMVTRASPLYCTFNLSALNTTMIVLAAVFEVGAVVLAVWTGLVVGHARWRIRALSSSGGSDAADEYMVSLTVRTLLFISVLAALFIAEITTTLESFSSPTTDILSAVCDLVAAGIFAADPHTLHALRARLPWRARASPPASFAITLTQHIPVDPSAVEMQTNDWKDARDEGARAQSATPDVEAASTSAHRTKRDHDSLQSP